VVQVHVAPPLISPGQRTWVSSFRRRLACDVSHPCQMSPGLVSADDGAHGTARDHLRAARRTGHVAGGTGSQGPRGQAPSPPLRGEIYERTEGRVSLHTRQSRVHEIVDRVKKIHPYEVPGISTRPIVSGNPGLPCLDRTGNRPVVIAVRRPNPLAQLGRRSTPSARRAPCAARNAWRPAGVPQYTVA
jgi:hypothetical protein